MIEQIENQASDNNIVTADPSEGSMRDALTRAMSTGNEDKVDSEPENTHNSDVTTENVAESETNGSESRDKPSVNSLKDLAETLEIDQKDLYKIEIPMGNGESLTLGEMKDLATGSKDLESKSMLFEEEKVKAVNELRQRNDELLNMASMMPKEALNPKLLEEFRGMKAKYDEREEEALLEAVPEWQDSGVRESEVSAINGHLKEYGLGDNLMGQVTDHNMRRYLRESWLRDQRIKKAMGDVAVRPPSKPHESGLSSKKAQKKAAPNTKPLSPRQKLNQIFK